MDFIATVATHCPFIDSSNTQAKLNDEDRLIAEVTSKFEDFTLQFLDSIFTLVELGSVDFVRQVKFSLTQLFDFEKKFEISGKFDILQST